MIDLAFTYDAALGRFDLVLSNGALDPTLVEGTDEIDQRLVRTIRLFRGDLLFDQTLGMPWYQQILAIKNNLPTHGATRWLIYQPDNGKTGYTLATPALANQPQRLPFL